MRQQRVLAAGAAIAAALIAAWLLWPAGRPIPSRNTSTESAAAPHEARVDGRGKTATAAVPIVTMGGPSEERLKRNLDEYKRVAVYPPWSRPFTEGTQYLLQWNKPATSDLPMSEKPGGETSYHFDADRAHVSYGEAIMSWIEVWKNGDATARVPITVEDAFVMGDVGPKTGRLVKLSYHDDGQDGDEVAGDGRYTNRLVPSSLPQLEQATQVHLSATVSCCDGVRRMFVREFTYAPRKVVEILGMSDGVRGGSLALTLDVNVVERGTYDFEANLMSGDGARPIGYSQMNYTLAPGRQKVDLVFFGRMFGEAGADGPYLVRDVRGLLLGGDADANIPFSYDGTYLTRPWRRAEFSPAEWDAPEKREKIAAMERLIAQTAAGQIGGPTAQPEHIEIDEHGVAHVVK